MQRLKGLSCCILCYVAKNLEDAKQDIYEIAKELIVRYNVKNFILDTSVDYSFCIDAIDQLKKEFDGISKVCFGNIYELEEMPVHIAEMFDIIVEIDYLDKSVNDLHRWHTMIKKSDFCVFYCEKKSVYVKRLQSFEWYAKKHKKKTKLIVR